MSAGIPFHTVHWRALSINFDWRDWRIGIRVFVYSRLNSPDGVNFCLYLGPLHAYADVNWWRLKRKRFR